MIAIEQEKLHKKGRIPDSLYSYITSQYISKLFVPVILRLGIKNPNTVTLFSFLMVLAASILLFFMNLNSIVNRVILAMVIELSFILDCADGQVARVLDKISIFGGWLDRYLDRIGEMALYTAIGWISWVRYGDFTYFILGVLLGFMFTYYSLSYSIKDSIFLEDILNGRINIKEKNSKTDKKSAEKVLGKTLLGKGRFVKVLSKLFFFLNIGMGERYLYPIFFIIIDRLDIMLIIMSILFTMRTINKNLLLFSRIKNNRIGVDI